MIITNIVTASGMGLKDMNGDGAISDVDVALMILDRLTEAYGQDLAVGDLDGNGVANGEDMVTAITRVVQSTFGKLIADDMPVSDADVAIEIDNVVNQIPAADINFDGTNDIFDVGVALNAMGTDPNLFNNIDTAAREIFEYIGAIRTFGRGFFMATEAVPEDHLQGVSSTWPDDHPRWWPPNHTTGVSRSYEPPAYPPNHTQYDSSQYPGPAPHQTDVSRCWPANHLKDASVTWPAPPNHGVFASFNEPPPPSHALAASKTWPASHMCSASSTWPADHDLTVSRTWWPQHTQADSSTRVWPPLHLQTVSNMWQHQTAVSQASWPPNHYPSVSNGWGPGHTVNISAEYPPGHLSYASTTWPGPQPTWPPSHTDKDSREWSTPTPSPWPPLFPPDHSWFTTFKDLHDVVPRIPWPAVVGGS